MHVSHAVTKALAIFSGATALGAATTPFSNDMVGMGNIANAATDPGPFPSDASPARRCSDPANHRAPETYNHFLRGKLADLPNVCVIGNVDDRKNCLLDLPYDEPAMVATSRLIEAGCSTSLPPSISSTLADTGREAWQLAREYRKQYGRDLRGKYSADAIEARLVAALRSMPADVQQAFHRADATIVVPRLTFERFSSGADEAVRNGLKPSRPDRQSIVPHGGPFDRDAMLGVYVLLTVDEKKMPMLISLASPQIITEVEGRFPEPFSPPGHERYEPPLRSQPEFAVFEQHFHRHSGATFGHRPSYLSQREGVDLHTVAHDKAIERALAEYLHKGVRRYFKFAAAGTRERVARESHRNVRQALCNAGTFGGLSPDHRARVLDRMEKWMLQVDNA